jgi:hypothetical protein
VNIQEPGVRYSEEILSDFPTATRFTTTHRCDCSLSSVTQKENRLMIFKCSTQSRFDHNFSKLQLCSKIFKTDFLIPLNLFRQHHWFTMPSSQRVFANEPYHQEYLKRLWFVSWTHRLSGTPDSSRGPTA